MATLRRTMRSLSGLLFSLSLTLLWLVAVTFFIGRMVPIDPVLAVVGDRASADIVARMRVEMGMHLPLYQQFWDYLGHVLRGEFGTSVLTANPVAVDIRRLFPATLKILAQHMIPFISRLYLHNWKVRDRLKTSITRSKD